MMPRTVAFWLGPPTSGVRKGGFSKGGFSNLRVIIILSLLNPPLLNLDACQTELDKRGSSKMPVNRS